jgi:hypothetical protein
MITFDIRTLGADDNERHTVRRLMEAHPSEVLRSYRFFKNIDRVIETVYAGDPPPPDRDVESLILVKISCSKEEVLLHFFYGQAPDAEELKATEEEEAGILADEVAHLEEV